MRTYTISSLRLKPRIGYKIGVFHFRYICTFNHEIIRHPTTAYTIDVRLQHHMLRQHIRQCTTMFAKKYFPTTEFFVAPKSFTCKSFFLIRSIVYETRRHTANNRDKSRQHTKNYDFLIRTLSHLKIRMWETSIMLVSHIRI